MKHLMRVQSTASGFHTVGYLDDASDENRLVKRAAEENIIVAPLNRYCLSPISRKGLVLGFGGTNPDEIRRGVAILKTVAESDRNNWSA